MSFKITYFHYSFGFVSKKTHILSPLRDNLLYVEDMVFALCKMLNIGPIAKYIFGLYHDGDKIWLASNQELNKLSNKYRHLEFRVRFRPFNGDDLMVSSNSHIVTFLTLLFFFLICLGCR